MIRVFLRSMLKPLSFVPALCMMVMIYSFSAEDGKTSAAFTYKVSVKVVETVDQVFDEVFCAPREARKPDAIPAFLPVDSGKEAALRQ